MSNSDSIETTCYLHVTPDFKGDKLRGIRVAKLTQSRGHGDPGSIAIKVRLRLPMRVFDPLSPEVLIDVPEDRVELTPEVTVDPLTTHEVAP